MPLESPSLDAPHSENGAHAPAAQFFDSKHVERLIVQYQKDGCRETLGEIVNRCQPITISLIRKRCTFAHEDEDELLAIVNRKLLISLPQFDRTRGSAFSFVSRLAVNMLCTTVTHRCKLASRYPALEESLALSLADERADLNSQLAVDDLVQQIRSIKSSIELEHERAAQRWYVSSFIDCGFELRRHTCSDACMLVYGLSHRRSRQLFDLTLLEVRRAVWSETKHPCITLGELRGTKQMPLSRYHNFLSPSEFSKFALLMKDLAPSLVLLVRPQNATKIKAGEWTAVRENLQLILDGDPEATPLF